MDGRETAEVLHTRFGGEWYCRLHAASFEHQEAERNDGACPWCGFSVEQFEEATDG